MRTHFSTSRTVSTAAASSRGRARRICTSFLVDMALKKLKAKLPRLTSWLFRLVSGVPLFAMQSRYHCEASTFLKE